MVMTGKIPYPLMFVINGQPMSKKRAWTPMCGRGRPRIILSAKYRAWQKGVVDELWVQRNTYQASMSGAFEPITEQVAVEMMFFLKGHPKVDLSNLYQGIEDALEVAGILKDDSQIESHDGSRKWPGADNPHVEITITPFY